jgi:hypothetical protein
MYGSDENFGASPWRSKLEWSYAMTEPKSVATSFKKGRKKTGGRKAGVPNKTTRFLREAIILAAEAVGSDGNGKDGLVGYLMKVANKNTAGFCSLLGRVMPLQIETEDEPKEKVHLTLEEARVELNKRGISDSFLIYLLKRQAEAFPKVVDYDYPEQDRPSGDLRTAAEMQSLPFK